MNCLPTSARLAGMAARKDLAADTPLNLGQALRDELEALSFAWTIRASSLTRKTGAGRVVRILLERFATPRIQPVEARRAIRG